MDAFLLPSLVTAVRFLADYLSIDQPAEQKAIVKILQLILSPNTITNEASMILSSVLNMVAKPLEHALRTYQRRDPKNLQIEPLLRGALKDSIPLSRRTGGAENQELESWTGASHGSQGLPSALRHTMQGFVQWSMHPGLNTMPTSYSHRQFLVGLNMFGAKRMLGIILDELVKTAQLDQPGPGVPASSNPTLPVMFDVATALICAPDVTNQREPPPMDSASASSSQPIPPLQRPLALREALKAEAEGCKKLHSANPGLAESVVRLYRKVESLMAPSQTEMLQVEMAVGAGALDEETMQAAAAAAAAGVSAVGTDALGVDAATMDIMGMGAADLLGGGAGGAGSGLGLDDDIFGGLDVSDNPFDGWDMNMMDMT